MGDDDDGNPQIKEVKYKARRERGGAAPCASIPMAWKMSVDIHKNETRDERRKGRSVVE